MAPPPLYIETPFGRMTYFQAGVCFGIPSNLIRSRVIYDKGVNEDTFMPKKRPGRKAVRHVTPWGPLTIAEIAARCGVKTSAIEHRFYHMQLPEERAFNLLRGSKRWPKYIMPPEKYREIVDALRKEAWKRKHAKVLATA